MLLNDYLFYLNKVIFIVEILGGILSGIVGLLKNTVAILKLFMLTNVEEET